MGDSNASIPTWEPIQMKEMFGSKPNKAVIDKGIAKIHGVTKTLEVVKELQRYLGESHETK